MRVSTAGTIGSTADDRERVLVTSKNFSIDSIDRRIIAELGQDARLSIRALAERVHISRTAAHTRLAKLIEHKGWQHSPLWRKRRHSVATSTSC